MNRYKKLKFVGEGSFARVYKVIDKRTKQICALKCIKKDGKSEMEIDKLMEEIMILQSLSHKNIIRIIEWFVSDQEICVVTEYAEKGELFKIIKHKNKQLTEYDIKIIAKQLVDALLFLHDARVIHRDIKPQNILLSADGTIKLCDFGFARALSEDSIMATSIKGTPLYMAPELVQEKPYNDKVDLWSLGVILYELYYGKPPFYTNSIYKLVKMIVKSHIKYPSQPPISKYFQNFINGLLQKNPLKRFDIECLHKHPFLMTDDQIMSAKKEIIKLKHSNKKMQSYTDRHLKEINYQKKATTKHAMKPMPIKCEEKDVETESSENNKPISTTTTMSSSPSVSSSSKESLIENMGHQSNENKENAAKNMVKQKVLDIIDCNNWSMIDKILIVLPQRWHSLCSSSTDTHFECTLFLKLCYLFFQSSQQQNAAIKCKNILNVLCLTLQQIQKNDNLSNDILKNVQKLIQQMPQIHGLHSTLCKFIKICLCFDDESIIKMVINEQFSSIFLSNFNKECFDNLLIIFVKITQHFCFDYVHCNELKSFSKSAMKQMPIYRFWANVEQKMMESKQTNAFFEYILSNQNDCEYALKFVLFSLMTCPNLRKHINSDFTLKRAIFLFAANNLMNVEHQMNALLIFYHFDDVKNESLDDKNICNALKTLSDSSNICISNLSQCILLQFECSVDYKQIWTKILKSVNISMDILFDCASSKFDKNIIDFWCHSVSFLEINNENIKLCITVCVQIFSILTKRIQQIIKTKTESFLISAKSLNIFLSFFHRILKMLISENSIFGILQSQKSQLLKEFLSKSNIATLTILGNPQFILQFVSIRPFFVDLLYDESISVCNICYCSLLLIYRFLACEYSKTQQLISPSPALSKFKSFTNHNLNISKAPSQTLKKQRQNDQIYNFHKITLEFQLICSILNFLQIASPKQKEEACNLLFYITWKQSLFMKEFLTNNGLLIVTNCIIKQRKYHSANIIIQCLQIISCTARKYKKFYAKIAETGIFTQIPQLLTEECPQIKEKICNLVGNLCKHSDTFLGVIKAQNLLNLLCHCTKDADSSNIRRFACYAIGNIAYQTTKQDIVNTQCSIDLAVCIKPLSERLMDDDYKTQENAAGAIGNLVSQTHRHNEEIIATIIKCDVIKLLLNEIGCNAHLSVIKNCLYSLSNMCYFERCKRMMLTFGWRHTLKLCLDKFGKKDDFVKKCAFKILRKMESKNHQKY